MAVDATLEDRVFSETKRHCYAGHDEATLLREVADRLRSAVPFEGYCAHTVDPLSGLIANAIPEQVGGEKEYAFSSSTSPSQTTSTSTTRWQRVGARWHCSPRRPMAGLSAPSRNISVGRSTRLVCGIDKPSPNVSSSTTFIRRCRVNSNELLRELSERLILQRIAMILVHMHAHHRPLSYGEEACL